MCGITGWTDWSRDLGEQRSILERMTRTLAPRGRTPKACGCRGTRCSAIGAWRSSTWRTVLNRCLPRRAGGWR